MAATWYAECASHGVSRPSYSGIYGNHRPGHGQGQEGRVSRPSYSGIYGNVPRLRLARLRRVSRPSYSGIYGNTSLLPRVSRASTVSRPSYSGIYGNEAYETYLVPSKRTFLGPRIRASTETLPPETR